jgi:hypothetical protein
VQIWVFCQCASIVWNHIEQVKRQIKIALHNQLESMMADLDFVVLRNFSLACVWADFLHVLRQSLSQLLISLILKTVVQIST